MPLTPTPETQALLDLVALRGLPPFNELTPHEARIAYAQRLHATALAAEPLPSVRDFTLPGAAGPLAVRLYSPRALPAAPQPLVLFFHGGGMVIGNLETHDRICRYIAKRGDSMVLAIDYRLAPEHRYPAAVEDALAAFDWTAENIVVLGGDPQHFIVVGDSAGGTLAAIVAQEARALRVCPTHQILIYPAVDQGGDYASRRECGEGFLLTMKSIAWFRRHYFGHDRPVLEPWASPICAGDLSGVAPALVITAGLDPLRDEGKAYAHRLAGAGVSVAYHCFEGTVHGFLGMSRLLQAGRDALDLVAAQVRTVGRLT